MLDGVKCVLVIGLFEFDYGDVLIGWVFEGYGIVLKVVFEVVDYLVFGWFVLVLEDELLVFV